MESLQKAIDIATKATEEDGAKNYEEAERLYQQAVEYFLEAIEYEAETEKSKESIREKCSQYLKRAGDLRKYLEREQNAIHDLPFTANMERPNVQWDDVAGLDKAKEVLKESVLLPIKFPQLFTNRNVSSGILLYGAPGTGKSLLARAVAAEASSANIVSVSVSDLVSKYSAGPEVTIRGLFQLAKSKSPSIMLIDDIDFLFEKEELSVQLQDLGRDGDRVLVLATTDRPWQLHPRLAQFFCQNIHIPLPEAPARAYMFKMHIGNTPHNLTERDFQELGNRTEGYSGADISIVVRDALMMPVRKVQSATHFKKVSGPSPNDKDVIVHDLLTPCSPGEAGAQEISWTDVPGDKLKEPLMDISDMILSLSRTRPTVNDDDLLELKKFGEKSKDSIGGNSANAQRPNVQLDDVVGLAKSKKILKDFIRFRIKFPQLFTNRNVSSGILLYGAPGTGKSLLARAVAAEASSANIVLFDNIEFLNQEEFLVQLHSLNRSRDGVVVLATTSRPWQLHARVRRFFDRKIPIHLPDLPTRVRLFRQRVGAESHALTDGDFQEFGSLTDGYSGADIVGIVNDARMAPVRKVQSATHFKKVSGPSPNDPSVTVNDLLTPCSPDEVGAIEMSWTDLKGDDLMPPVVNAADVKLSISRSKPSVNDGDLLALKQFTDDFGPSEG